MRIGIFSKLGSSGGSEHRCAEMANIIVKSGHEAFILAEKGLNKHINEKLDKRVKIYTDVFGDTGINLGRLYEVDSLLVVNTDSKAFPKLDYWEGRSDHHKFTVDLTKIKQMIFLFNYGVRAAETLDGIMTKCKDVRILCGNKQYYNLLATKPDFTKIKHIPRIILDSPIDPESVTDIKSPSDKIRIGKHSKPISYKFNSDHKTLINAINMKHPDVQWDFLGVPEERIQELSDIKNVAVRQEFSLSVKDYLQNIDIFLFFVEYKRSEPWSRAIAEAQMSGCPVIANKSGGNGEQILNGNNGYLCDNLNDFYNNLNYL